MIFIADENVDRLIVEALRQAGHSVEYIAETDPSVSDDVVFNRANDKRAVLLTADNDFGEMVFRDQRLIADGVILIRLAGLSSQAKADIVCSAIGEHGNNLQNRFTVISPGNVRSNWRR